MRTRTRKHIPLLEKKFSDNKLGIIVSGFFSAVSLLGMFFLTGDFIPPAFVIFCMSFITFLFLGVPQVVNFLSKKEKRKYGIFFLLLILFLVYVGLAFLLGGFNPFTLSFIFMVLLLGPFGIFLVVGGFFIDDLHTVILRIRKYALGNFLVFPFLYSGISKIIGKEDTYAGLAFTLFILLLGSFWFYSRGKVLKNIMRFWLFLNKGRIIERKKWNPLIDNFLSEEKSLKINLTQSNKYIDTPRLERGFIFEEILVYVRMLGWGFIIGILLGLRISTFPFETEWIKMTIVSGCFGALGAFFLMLAFSRKIYRSILARRKDSISLSAYADSFYRVNKQKVIFYKK